MKRLAAITLALTMITLAPGLAQAQWSDHEWNKRQGQSDANRILKYGGTYTQAGNSIIRHRDAGNSIIRHRFNRTPLRPTVRQTVRRYPRVWR